MLNLVNGYISRSLKLKIGLVDQDGKQGLKSNRRLLNICLGIGNVNIESEGWQLFWLRENPAEVPVFKLLALPHRFILH
jgi:hypothetical protein